MDDFLKMYYNVQEVAIPKEQSDLKNKISKNIISKKENNFKTEINDKIITEQQKKKVSEEKRDKKKQNQWK